MFLAGASLLPDSIYDHPKNLTGGILGGRATPNSLNVVSGKIFF